MDLDSESTATSLDENTENFCDNPTRDTIAEGLMGLIKPTVDQLDERVRATRISQLELKQCIESLSEELKKISETQQHSVDLEVYLKKLINAKQRVTVLSNILQNAQERLNRVHMSIDKETVKRKVLLNNTVEDPENSKYTGLTMALLTPCYNLHDYPDVYEPCEDTHLFLDALEKDQVNIIKLKPLLACEIGCGSGVLITALATILKNTCTYFCTDINLRACAAAKKTSIMNGVDIESLGMNLTSFLRCSFDVILFNPPYVVTERKEIAGSGLNRAYAGGRNGREIIDNFLKTLPKVLTKKGVCYMLLLKENKIEEIEAYLSKFGFQSVLAIERKIPGEHLFVYKFFR